MKERRQVRLSVGLSLYDRSTVRYPSTVLIKQTCLQKEPSKDIYNSFEGLLIKFQEMNFKLERNNFEQIENGSEGSKQFQKK